MIARMRQRRDTAAGWTSANPTLGNGEFGYETDTGKLKVGDGSTAWASLAYWTGGSAVAAHKTSHATGGSDAIAAADIGASPASHAALTTTAHGGIVASSDSRLTDARTPTAHKTSHATGGTDALAAADIGAEPTQTAASQAEMEAGTEAGIRSMSPLRVAQAIAALGGGVTGTGAVDNAVLRADGTGGAAMQGSDVIIDDYGRITRATINAPLEGYPNGTGGIRLALATGQGGARGALGAAAVDLGFPYENGLSVGGCTFAAGSYGGANTNHGVVIGRGQVTALYASAIGGENSTASGMWSFVGGGKECTAAGALSRAGGHSAVADLHGSDVWGAVNSPWNVTTAGERMTVMMLG